VPEPNATAAPTSAGAIRDLVLRILGRAALRYDLRADDLTLAEVRTLMELARATSEIEAMELDPLGPARRKRLEKVSGEELRAMIETLEARGAS
jgi:hypothetical protein